MSGHTATMPDSVALHAASPELAVHYAGLGLPALTTLVQLVPQVLGEKWHVIPWLGKMDCQILVTGHGRQATIARRCASAAMFGCVTLDEQLPEIGQAAYLKASLLAATRRQRPAQSPYALARQGGALINALCCTAFDLRTHSQLQHWHHPTLGQLHIDGARDWVFSTLAPADVVGSAMEPGWRQMPKGTALASGLRQHSLESWILRTVLRWRDRFPAFPDDLEVQLADIPDIVSVSGQPPLLQALLAMRQATTLAEVQRRTGVNRGVLDALVSAAALCGCLTSTAFTNTTLPVGPDVRTVPSRLQRLAHFLGISRAFRW